MSTMTPERWQEISPHLDHLLSLPADERSAWLESFRQEKPNLADLLQKLLEEHSMLAREGFLEAAPLRPENASSLAGQTIGAYALVSPIGQGGMGSVWLAERSDGRFERRVAVKFLHYAVATQGGAERFKREGRILAQFAHPHIAELIDAGVTAKGEPYLVLEHVDGEQIDQYCDQRRLDVDARIRLFLDVLSAVTQAHASLIVHRDIKPSNVLVRNDGQVKLLDFGIAKLLAAEGNPSVAAQLTMEGGALTPQFAAPEQVTGGAVTTATDIYGLGVLLYLLLAGQHPAGRGPQPPADLVKAITETDAPLASQTVASADEAEWAARRDTTPAKLRRRLRGDVDTILAKALKKKPEERYPSVTAFGDDLRRYLRHEPIRARPDTLAYRAAKFVRRNRPAVALATVALAAALAGITGTLIQARTARKQRDLAFRQLARAVKINDLNEFLLSDAQSSRPITVDELLERAERIVERRNYADDPVNHVHLLVSIGRQYCERLEHAKALPVLQQAYQLSRGLSDSSARAQASCALAAPLYRRAEFARAESLIQEGLRELPLEPQFAMDRVSCLLGGASVAAYSGDGQGALAREEAAARIVENSTFASDYLRLGVLTYLASGYLGSGQVSKTIAEYKRASLLMRDLGYDGTDTAAQLYTGWGVALLNAGQPYEAEKILHRALEISGTSRTNNEVNPILLNQYSDALRQLGRLDEAADYAQRGYARAQQTKDSFIADLALLKRAQIYREQHDLASAAEMLDRVEPLIRRDNSSAVSVNFVNSERSLLAQATGDLPRALNLADQVVATAEAESKVGRIGGTVLPRFLLRRSSTELEAKEPDKALADAERAMSLLQAGTEPGMFSTYIGLAYLNVGRALQAQRKSNEAHAAFLSAAQHLENALGPDHPDSRTARQLASLGPH